MSGDEFKIVWNGGHCELYINGTFYCSADNMTEAVDDLEEYLKEMER